jgi:Mg2+ and Co2+ transporter CorA
MSSSHHNNEKAPLFGNWKAWYWLVLLFLLLLIIVFYFFTKKFA